MKNLFFTFIIMVLLPLSSFAQSEQTSAFEAAREKAEQEIADKRAMAGDVRGLVWGVTSEDVEGFENDLERLGRHEDKIVYTTKDFDFPASVIYQFYKDQLTRADVEYEQIQTIPQEYLNDYMALQDKISEIYGEPVSDEVNWRSDMYKNDPERWGLAVMMGALRLQTMWSTPRSVITLDFRGKRMKQSMRVTYISKTIIRAEEDVNILPQSR